MSSDVKHRNGIKMFLTDSSLQIILEFLALNILCIERKIMH